MAKKGLSKAAWFGIGALLGAFILWLVGGITLYFGVPIVIPL